MKAGGGIKGVEAEIDRYVGEFWTEADNLGIDYLISVMTEDEKAAWGVAAQGGLNQDIKNEITQNYKSEIMPNLINILGVLNDKNMDEISEIYFSQYESLCRSMNQVMTIQLIDGTKEADKTSMYAGCIVRFKGLKGKVDDPKKWEVVLDNNGQGVIKCTFLAHLMVNAGDVLEVVKVEGNKERVIYEQKFKIKLPLSRVILEMPEQGVWELQGVYYVRHFQWVGKSGTSIADQWLDMSINDDATAYSYSYKDKDTAKDGKGVLPGAVVTAEQLAETFSKQIALDKAIVATLVEGIPEGYDFRNVDDKSLNSFKKETHYMFQEAGSGKESFFSTAAAVPNANGSRVLLIDLSEPGAKGFRLIYRECSSDIASGYKWQEYGVEQIDRM